MDVYSQIAQKLKNIANPSWHGILFSAKVLRVDKTVCDVLIDDLTVTGVRLRSVINNSDGQLLIMPKIGSYVIVGDLSDGYLCQLVVISYSEIDAVNIKIGNTTVDLDENGIVMNGGELKGLVKVDAMTTWMQKVYADLQTLKLQLSTHPVTGNGAPLAMAFSPSTPNPQASQFTNEKIKQ